MADAPKRIKASEAFRGRVLARFRAALHGIQKPEYGADPTQGYIPRSSNDTALTAFAQLAALRLDASRAFISLISPDTQYILAESTRTLSLQSDTRHDIYDSLWMGCVAVPRDQGVCGLTLENAIQTSSIADTLDGDITVIEDMQDHPRTKSAAFVTSGVCLRFYAGAPIRTPDGVVIGVLCVFDNKPRSGLSDDQKTILKDISATVMDHLEASRIRAVHARTEKLITGLESFIDGLANTRTSDKLSKSSPETSVPLLPETTQQLAMQDVATDASAKDAENKGPQVGAENSDGTCHGSLRSLWNQAMAPGSRPMFSRAANIIRQSGDYDGCAIFYMPSTRKSHHPSGITNSRSASPSDSNAENKVVPDINVEVDASYKDSMTGSAEQRGGTSDTDDSSGINQLSPKRACPLLSHSLASEGAEYQQIDPFPQFKLRDMERLAGKHPRPRSFTLNQAGDLIPSDTSSSGSGPNEPPNRTIPGDTEPVGRDRGPQLTHRQLRLSKSLKKLSPSAQSYACLPLWDSERQRYIAYCICWTSSPLRHLKEDGDLGYLRVFGNSISIVLSHIDTIASNRVKATFVSSISHELRSPLHGILSATNFLRESKMTRFDREMINVVSNCGRTLLDTVDHVMDFAKISAVGPKKRRRRTDTSPTPGQTALSEDVVSSLSANIDLSSLIEDVLETVLLGFNVQHDFLYSDDESPDAWPILPQFKSSAASLGQSQRILKARGKIRFILDMPYRKDWMVYTQPGAWRRILMNLFGNALKYTENGLIAIRLQIRTDDASAVLPLSLEVTDTGKGMSNHYMETGLYMAFSQEDPLSSGTGLGLNIVKQIVEVQGGTMQLSSTQGVGTNVRVNLSVPGTISKPLSLELEDSIENFAERTEGLRVFLLEDIPNEEAGGPESLARRAEIEFRNSLASTLKQWFKVEVSHGTSWPSSSVDFIMCLKPMLKYLENPSKYNITGQPVMIIAYDALEMAVLQADARVTRNDAVIEIASQPLGPHKLARMLKQCLIRKEKLPTLRPELQFTNTATSIDTLPLLLRSHSPSLPSTNTSTTPNEPNDIPTDRYRDPFILIVDDNKINLRLLSVFIKKQGFAYHEATNGQEAVDIFRVAKNSVLCILMDISMPVLDGMAATRIIREIEKQESNVSNSNVSERRTSVIALTGLTSAASRNEAFEAGMDEFLTKPITFSQLEGHLKSLKVGGDG